ncbi:hypothetical protein AVEN_28837-1 [Araneus ventricosus]|uniref:Mutator-like transposase domain-containing protein n=1 Tax=Araneus ventricosus TaxID=182803 RepID=A0A4Y2M421_ARAVE|nr:hypothetical protein AVEN_28837-1 [Araneus ventricosus]
MQKAAKEAIVENNSDNNIPVAVGGTLQMRGYTSHNGVVAVTSNDTGKVIDVDVLSKYCACRNEQNHEKSCKSNFRGSSGMMEVEGACNIFKRFFTFHKARYTKYLGDGDSTAFDVITKENIYGDEFQAEKLECIGHVVKRMGSRLRVLKEKMKGQLLSDARAIGDKYHVPEIVNHRVRVLRKTKSSLVCPFLEPRGEIFLPPRESHVLKEPPDELVFKILSPCEKVNFDIHVLNPLTVQFFCAT